MIEFQTIKYNEQSDAKLQNYFESLQNNCSNIASLKQKKTPKLSDLEVAALGLTAEYLSLFLLSIPYLSKSARQSALNAQLSVPQMKCIPILAIALPKNSDILATNCIWFADSLR